MGHIKSEGEIAPKTRGKVELIEVQPYSPPKNHTIISFGARVGLKVVKLEIGGITGIILPSSGIMGSRSNLLKGKNKHPGSAMVLAVVGQENSE